MTFDLSLGQHRHSITRSFIAMTLRPFVDQWFRVIRSADRQNEFHRYLQQLQRIDPILQRRLVNDIVQRSVDEDPRKEIRWMVDRSNQSHRSTSKDLFDAAIRYGDVLLGSAVKLTAGNNVRLND